MVFLKFALILIFLEFAFDLLAEVRVGALVDIDALFAGGREGGVLAHQGALVEEGAVAAHEGEVVDLLHGADLIGDGVAHVEQLEIFECVIQNLSHEFNLAYQLMRFSFSL